GPVVDHRADREAGADEGPGGASVVALLVQRLRAFERELDGECRNQRARRESEQAGKRPFGKRQIKSDDGSKKRRRCRGEAEEGSHAELIDGVHLKAIPIEIKDESCTRS